MAGTGVKLFYINIRCFVGFLIEATVNKDETRQFHFLQSEACNYLSSLYRDRRENAISYRTC